MSVILDWSFSEQLQSFTCATSKQLVLLEEKSGRERERETERERQRETERERQRERGRETKRERKRDKDREEEERQTV